MKTIEMSPETQAVVERLMTGKAIDPDVRRRIREKAATIRERIFREHGFVNVAVPAVRELRDDPGA